MRIPDPPEPRSRRVYAKLASGVQTAASVALVLSAPWLIGFVLCAAGILGLLALGIALQPGSFSMPLELILGGVGLALDYTFWVGLVVAVIMFVSNR